MLYLPIVPFANLDILDSYDTGLCLTNLFKQNKSYVDYYTTRKWKRLIVDMGTFEGDPSTPEEIAECIDLFDFDLIEEFIVVCPDDLYNGDVTVSQTKQFIKDYLGRWPISFMAVPQGKTLEEYLECATQLAKIEEIEFFGISRLSAEDCTTDRCTTLRSVMPILKYKKVHMLGMNSPLEPMFAKQWSNIESIDSCMAALYALHSREVPLTFSKGGRIKTPHDLFTQILTDDQIVKAHQNINKLTSVC
jgi:hypothetical protein